MKTKSKSKSISKLLIFNMAIRNIRRNTRRSLLSASAIFIIIAASTFLFGFIDGQINDAVADTIDQVSGNIRVQNQRYSDNERVKPLQFFIPQTDELLAFIKAQKGVAGAEPHIRIGAIVDPNKDQVATSLIGVNFETSRIFSDPNTKIISGTLPTSNDKNVAVINPFMAERFTLKVGDKFTLSTTTAIGHNLITVSVSAIAAISNIELAGLTFFMDWKLLSDKLRMNGNAIEILVHTKDNISANETENLIVTIQNYAKTDSPLEVKEWHEIGIIFQQIQALQTENWYNVIILTFMASTIIFSSTMMAVLERKKEIGTLMSLGMDAKHIKNLFLLESALLAFFASLAAILIGFIIVTLSGTVGINLVAGNISLWVYPSLTLQKYLLLLFTGTAIATLACIIPARMALKVQPSEALRSAE